MKQLTVKAMTVVASTTINGLGKVNILEPETIVAYDEKGEKIKQRKVRHLQFNDVVIPGNDKRPSMPYTATVDSITKVSDMLEMLGPQASGFVPTFKGKITLPLLTSLAKAKDSKPLTFAFNAMVALNAFVKANAPEAPGAIRNVEAWKVKMLADLLLVFAGTTGEIPESCTFVGSDWSKAQAMAKTKAQELGLDSNGQFRLRTERTTSDSVKPEEDNLDSLLAEEFEAEEATAE